MKSLFGSVLLCLFIAVCFGVNGQAVKGQGLKKKSSKPRIIYNDDNTSLSHVPQPHTPEKVHGAVDYLKDTQVDILCWMMTARWEAYAWESKVLDNFYDREKYDENSRNLKLGLHVQGIDFLPILISRTQENGIQFFASFRMNDIHHNSRPSAAPAFWKSNQDYRLWEVTNSLTYYNACLDYSYPEVRDRMFNAMVEVAEKYDIDGLEIDFCREPYTFPPSEGWSKRQILTDYFKKIRSMLERVGKKRGRKIELMIRVPFSEQHLAEAGMDVKTWIRDDMMDILVMSNRNNDYNQKLEPWLTLCKKNNIQFYPSVTVSIARRHEGDWRHAATLGRHLGGDTTTNWTNAFTKLTRASAQNYLSQGAAGIYMFNYPCALFDRQNRFVNKDPLLAPLLSVLSEVGSEETLRPTDKLYYFYTDLPIVVQANRPKEYHQTVKFTIGDSDLQDNTKRLSLWFRQEVQKNPHAIGSYEHSPVVSAERLKYYLNDWEIPSKYVNKTIQPAGSITGFDLSEHELVEINLPGDKFVRGENRLAFHTPFYPREDDPYIYIYELEVEVTQKK